MPTTPPATPSAAPENPDAAVRDAAPSRLPGRGAAGGRVNSPVPMSSVPVASSASG
ncbi:hypothetical protein ABZ362_11075 [Streptomyces sp. NPDC005951]|uniref:hypothetical protein n=1 Tax=Streptomyces sp. NPDC005951 TaxID=3154573 RepID=UPI003400D2BF